MMYSSDMTEDTRMSAIKGTYRPLKVLDHEFLGRVHVLQHYATSQLLIMKERTANNRDHFREEEALIEKRAALRHPNVMILKDWSMKTESKLCAEFYILRTFMQYYTDNVELIARKKIKEQTVFDDIELVQLLYDGIDGLSYLQSQGYSHGFLRPELILKDEKKSYVICDRLLEGSAIDAQRYARSSNFDLYCSPEVWNNLVNHKSHPTNGYLDDAFAFGLILLRVANLQSPKEIYLPSGLIDQNRLNSLIEKAASRYDHVILFRQVLEKLLSIDPKSRTDATAIKAGLPNRQQIQMFFDAETEDLYFDGPKSQMHNTMLGRESVLPVPQKNQSLMLGRSSAGDRSNYLAGLNNSSAYRPTGGARDPIFTSGNVLPPQTQGNANFGNDSYAGYNARPQYGGPSTYSGGAPQHIQQFATNQYTTAPLNNSHPNGQTYGAPQNYQYQAAPQALPRQVYQQPSTSLGQNQMIPSQGQTQYAGSNPLIRSTVNSVPPGQNLAFEQQGQNRIVAQQSPTSGYTGGNPFLAGPATNGVAAAPTNFNAGTGAGPSSYQAYGQGAAGVRAGPATAQLQAQTGYSNSPTNERPVVQTTAQPARPTGQSASGAGSRQSNYMQGDPNMIAPPKTGNKFAPL